MILVQILLAKFVIIICIILLNLNEKNEKFNLYRDTKYEL
jgi:hypothetical protein